MFAILTPLLSFLGGPVIKGALDAYAAKLKASGDHDKLTIELASRELAVEQREAELRTQLLIAEQGHWVTRSIRPLFGLAAAILVWKILVWDLALGQWTDGSTDKLSDQAFWLLTTIVGAYMGGRTIEHVATILKRK